jgi:inward rectifier potassium channel
MQTATERFKNIKKIGIEHSWLDDLYHRLLVTSWVTFACSFFAAFIAFNMFFAGLYLIVPNSLGNSSGSFFEAFSFSVQTFSTIGYGILHPNNSWAHSIVVLESMFSILITALLTGLAFAKFAKPSARILFSNNILINTYDGRRTLMFRIGNLRGNQIVEANIRVIALVNFKSKEGETLRRQVDLKLVRHSSLFFALTWNVMHIIDEDSPYFGLTHEQIIEQNIELGVSVVGYDETFSQTIHANAMYAPKEFIFDKYFADITLRLPDGGLQIDYTKFHALK